MSKRRVVGAAVAAVVGAGFALVLAGPAWAIKSQPSPVTNPYSVSRPMGAAPASLN